ncbi:hypothetical protein RugamoR64_06300 [Duganella rhizosphaerae]|uniref:colicin immunity domain-containing protein n=1 Tax=Duganella rhizosphaerae TaxID=2885763 RepID=UPI0030E77409
MEMTYLRHQKIYQDAMAQFVQDALSADEFIIRFMQQWRLDRDALWEHINAGKARVVDDRVFCEIMDQVFTACDCYSPEPSSPPDISAAQLKSEVRESYQRWWTEPGA